MPSKKAVWVPSKKALGIIVFGVNYGIYRRSGCLVRKQFRRVLRKHIRRVLRRLRLPSRKLLFAF